MSLIDQVISALKSEDVRAKASRIIDRAIPRYLGIHYIENGETSTFALDNEINEAMRHYNALHKLGSFLTNRTVVSGPGNYLEKDWFWGAMDEAAELLTFDFGIRPQTTENSQLLIASHWSPRPLRISEPEDALALRADRPLDYVLLNEMRKSKTLPCKDRVVLKGARSKKGGDDISLLLIHQRRDVTDKELRDKVTRDFDSGRERLPDVSDTHIRVHGIYTPKEGIVDFDNIPDGMP